ncbi:elongation factor Ts, partial [Tremellales sp. Uapishka_1]
MWCSHPLRASLIRHLSTTPARCNTPKTPIALIAALRKTHPVSLSLAKEALQKSNNDLPAALVYLTSSANANSETKAKKLSSRTTDEGLISISLLGGKRIGMIQLACETDFVARNQVFLDTARGVSETAAFLDVPTLSEDGELPSSIPPPPTPSFSDPILDFPVEALSSAPLITLSSTTELSPTSPQTIHETLLASLSLTGENLKLIRAVNFAAPFPSSPETRFIPGGYAHGGSTDREGKVGGIVVLKVESLENETNPIVRMMGKDDLENQLLAMARNVARQIVGFPTKYIEGNLGEKEERLLEQPFMMYQGESRSVGTVLEEWAREKGVKISVVGMRRWSIGDEVDAE